MTRQDFLNAFDPAMSLHGNSQLFTTCGKRVSIDGLLERLSSGGISDLPKDQSAEISRLAAWSRNNDDSRTGSGQLLTNIHRYLSEVRT